MNNRHIFDTVSINLSVKRFLLALYGVVLLTLCVSCSFDRGKTSGAEGLDIKLAARFFEAPADAKDFYFSSSDLFYRTSEGIYRYGFDEDGNPSPVRLPVPVSEFNVNKVYAKMLLTDDGEIIRVEQIGQAREGKFFLEKYDKEGRLLFCKDISLEAGPSYGNYQISSDGDGNIYFAGKENMICFDPDGGVTQKIPLDAYDIHVLLRILRSGSHVWLFYGKENAAGDYAARIAKDGTLTDERKLPGFWQKSCSLTEDRFLHAVDGKLYLTDFENNSTVLLTQWSDLGISLDEVGSFMVTEEGRLIAALEKDGSFDIGEIALIFEADETSVPEKENLTLGVFYANRQLRSKIAKFNRSQEEIWITLKEYGDQNLAADDKSGINTLHLDIVSGKCPDILCLDDQKEIGDLAYKNAFEDLSPYIDGERGFNLTANIRDAYTFNGRLAGVPAYVKVRTLLLWDSGYTGEWTMEGFMDYLSERKDAGAEMPDPETVLRDLLTCNLDRFVDFEAGRCDFTSGKFEALLSFSRDISGGGNTKAREILTLPHEFQKADLSKAEMAEIQMKGLWDISLLEGKLRTEELNFAGYPHDGTESGNILEAVGGAFSISASSEYKSSAWEFIRYMAKEDQKATTTIYLYDYSGFPAEADSRKEYYQYTGPLFSFNGMLFRTPGQEETDLLETIVSNADMLSGREADILEIIMKEAREYFTTDKPVRLAAEIVQSKVELYLRE